MTREFTSARLELARQRRGLTKRALAEKAGVTTRSLVAWASGTGAPSVRSAQRLADALGFPLTFFYRLPAAELHEDAPSFRSLSKRTAAERDSARAAGTLAIELDAWIADRFHLPPPNLPPLRNAPSGDSAADVVRQQWGLGERPISNLVHLLESCGVRVFSLAQDCETIDAFSFWHGDTPFVLLNTRKTAERSRFDAAHELGHLVLHRHQTDRGKEVESEADAFGAAFLMPRRAMFALPRVRHVRQVLELKVIFGVSAMAFVHRLHTLGLLTEWHYRSLCIELTQLGYRTSEPNSRPWEASQVLSKVLGALRSEGTSADQIARELDWPRSELDGLLFGLAMFPIRGEGQSAPRSGPDLRLV